MIHLLIMNGPEKRDAIVEKAIDVSISIFDKIAILQNGICNGHSNPRIESYTKYKFDHFIGHLAAYNLLTHDIPIGDYVLMLDSDETPARDLLAYIAAGNFGDANSYGVQYMHHEYENDGTPRFKIDSGEAFRATRFFRREYDMYAKTHMGSHQTLVNVNPTYQPLNYHINHFKFRFSIFMSTFSHGVDSPASMNITNGLEYEILTDIKKKYGIAPDFIYQNFENKALFRQIQDEIRDLEVSSVPVIKDILNAVDFVVNTDKDLLELNSQFSCNESCCNA